MKRLLWIAAALAIALISGACSNATDATRAGEDLPAIVGEGLDITTLSSLDDIFFSQRENISLKLGLEGASSLSIDPSGSLPSGLSMDSTGLITGTADIVAADATANFTVVSDTGIEAPITWTLKAPRTRQFTANGNWTVPDEPGYSINSTITLQVLMAGGGGGGANSIAAGGVWRTGGGGGGGQVIEEAVQATPGETIVVTIGGGGASGVYRGDERGSNGGTTDFGSYLSAVGGGGGGIYNSQRTPPAGGNPGGAHLHSGTGAGGSGINGKTSVNSYDGSTVTLGGGGAGINESVGSSLTGGTGGGASISNRQPGGSHPNTGGGGAGGTSGAPLGTAGATGVAYVNY